MDRNPVDWYEGMFLRPQHFQTQDRHYQHQLSQNFDSIAPHPWGIHSLEIDQDALNAGRLVVRHLRARFASGRILNIPQDQSLDPLPIRSLAGSGQDLEIHVALPISLDVDGKSATQSVEENEILVPDEHDGQLHPVRVRRLKPILLPANDVGSGYDSIPIVSLRRSANSQDGVEIVPGYIPPLLSAEASSVLKYTIVESLNDIIHRKLEAMSTGMGNGHLASGNRIFSDPALFIRLSLLNQAAAKLESLGNCMQLAPIWIYRDLCDLIGRLAILGISQNRKVGQLPKYNHQDLGPVFFALKRQIQELVESLEEPGYFERSFVGMATRMQVSLESNWLDPGWTLLIGVRTNLEHSEALNLLSSSGPIDFKISSSERVDMLYRMGQRGLHFQSVSQVPEELKNIKNTVFLSLGRDAAANEWASVRNNLNLAVRFNESLLIGSIHDQTTVQLRYSNRPIQMAMTLFAISPHDQRAISPFYSKGLDSFSMETGSGSA
jgi:type VI secretion system protein ImpJ